MRNIARYILMTAILCLGAVQFAFAQQRVSGKVTDTNNHPMPGVSVIVKGTTTGTTTKSDGTYSITVSGEGTKVLEFRFIGYTTKEQPVTGEVLNVTLEEDAELIEEVVVVGYGTMRKSDLTGSVTSVKINEIEAAQVTSFDKLLQGKAAGVQVTTGSSAPGGAVNIKIRGTSTFSGTGEPLYVVDGIILNPASQDVKNAMGSTGQETQNALTSINPQDIENIEVLKDASATAIYGSMGANGVILITTKTGTSETPRVEYTGSVEVSMRSKKIPVLDLDGFIEYGDAIGYKKLSADTLTARDWQDYTMRLAVSQSHRVSVSGQTKKSNYYIAGGYMSNEGILKNTDLSQGDMRVNYDYKITDKIKVGTKVTFTNRINNMTQGTEPGGTQNASRATNMMKQMLGSKPYLTGNSDDEGYDEESLSGTDKWLQNYEDLSKEYRVNAMAFMDIKITDWLTFKSSFGSDYRNKERSRWYGEYLDNARNGRGAISALNSFRYNIDNTLSFSKRLRGGHRLNATLGISIDHALNKHSTVDASDFPDHEFRTKAIYSARSITPTYSEDENSLLSYFGRFIYNYKDRYVLTTTFRADGSSKFNKANRFSYFPSFAVAWRIDQEQFMSDVEFISNMKLRVGWGLVGNQGLSPYQTLTTYTGIKTADPNTDYNTEYNGSFIMGIKPNILANQNLKWETTEQYNVGLDMGFFRNRLNVTVDVYQKYTKDLLQSIAAPLSTGFSSMWVNRGKIRNKGIEIAADGYVIDKKDFTFSLSGNISFNKNKIMDVGLPEAWWGNLYGAAFLGADIGNDATYFKMPANIFLEGRPVALFYGFKTDGLVTQEDVDAGNLPTYRGQQLVAGDIKYVDIDESGNIDDKDKTLIGNPNPKFVYGFSTNFTYKRVSLSLFFNGTYGNKIVNGNLMQEEDTAPSNPSSNINNIRADAFYDAWSVDNPGGRYPRLRRTNNVGDFTDRIVEDGSYLRLSSVILSYSLPLKNTKWIKNVGLSFTARNVFILTKYSGWDPDVSSFSNSSQKIGVDWGSYPATRSYSFGVNLVF